MYRVLPILTEAEVEQCRAIAASAPFVDGRISNPHNTAKANEQLHDAAAKPSRTTTRRTTPTPTATVPPDTSRVSRRRGTDISAH